MSTSQPAGERKLGNLTAKDTRTLREFIRVRGQAYLKDPNVSSIGVGYKVVDGTATDQISVQFTVHRKLPIDELAPQGTHALPESIEVEQLAVPTDVLEVSYVPSYVLVPEAAPSARTKRHDPVVPGVSISNETTSAGTLGAIVYGREDGTAYGLSNWHVLHGPGSHVGVRTVQPGMFDDNRPGHNSLGELVRSHLGPAGDCAITSLDDRRFEPTILELDVVPEEIGDPELGDKVVKSGRTSGVTYGVVKRVDVLTTLDYGDGHGEQHIGGFEIGPDPSRGNELELSESGDSGAVWMFRSGNGRTSRVMAGLHFAGDAGGGAESALACLPASVFEKLDVSLNPTAYETVRAEAAAAPGHGYDPGFLGRDVALPTLNADVADDAAPVKDGGEVAHHTHFSLTMSASRRLARWVAWNIDGESLKKLSRSSIDFSLDPLFDPDHQMGDEVYKANDLDRGHLARRADLTWGPREEAQRANEDSFYFSNISPQINSFNQSSRGGLWGRLEDAVYEEVNVDRLRLSVFGGPVFRDDDREYRGVRIPREFWKVLAFSTGGTLTAKAFLLTQNLDRLETLDLREFETYQLTLEELTERTGVQFAPALTERPVPEALTEPRVVKAPGDVVW